MQIVNVRLNFDKRLKSFFSEITVKKGDFVVVNTSAGESVGQVESAKDFEGEIVENGDKIVRIATSADMEKFKKVIEKSRQAVQITQNLAKQLNLDMKVVNAEYNFDLSKVIIQFIADDRVDFRDLIKELVSTLKTRIELKQIGTREQAQLVGGIGVCGRECCCSLYLKDFEKVSIKMAKTQNLALNSSKISGSCGRLMCCLGYENEYYSEVGKIMPKLNSEVDTPNGKGTVIYQNFLKQLVSVKFVDKDGGSVIKDFSLSQLQNVQTKDKNSTPLQNKVEVEEKNKDTKKIDTQNNVKTSNQQKNMTTNNQTQKNSVNTKIQNTAQNKQKDKKKNFNFKQKNNKK